MTSFGIVLVGFSVLGFLMKGLNYGDSTEGLGPENRMLYAVFGRWRTGWLALGLVLMLAGTLLA